MKLKYFCNYDQDKKDFWAYVVSPYNFTIFEIHNSDDMLDLIESDVMENIDDITGLEKYLKHENVIEEKDEIVLGGVA